MMKNSLKSFFFICYFIFLIIGGAALLLYSKIDLFLFINKSNHYSSDYFFRYFTNVGDGIFYGIVILGLLCYKYKYAIIGLISFLLTSLIAQLLKRLVFVDEYRPVKYFKDLDIEFHIIEGVKLYSNNSFPSGHATTAFSIFCLLALIFKKNKLGFLFFLCAFLASYSRIYIGQHFFADIYFGSLIGVVFTILVYMILNKYFDNHKKTWPNKGLLNKGIIN
ncbi:MAG TPA: phosphatase PAP2 family protein [Cytophagales bacterium]|nr:phosphatase PAP2 family protein [Cytophagales bacterium]